MSYFFCLEHVKKDGCEIKYWYEDFEVLSAKEKLSWLKFEYPYEYDRLSKQDKKDFINYGCCYCRNCDELQYYDKYDYGKED